MTATGEDGLKWILVLRESGLSPTTSVVGKRVGVSPGTMATTIRRLTQRGLVENDATSRGALALTLRGAAAAIWIIRRHRVLELFLQQVLGYGWDAVHAEASRLEHALSNEVVERMARVLSDPHVDPHGAPIPTTGVPFCEPLLPALPDLQAGQRAVLRRVRVRDSAMLRYLAGMGLCLGVELEILEKAPFEGPISLRVGSSERALGHELSLGLRAQPIETEQPGKGMRGYVRAA